MKGKWKKRKRGSEEEVMRGRGGKQMGGRRKESPESRRVSCGIVEGPA